MIPYGKQFIDKKDIDGVVKVLKSDWLTQGPKILEFEKTLAKYCGVKYAVAVNSGTAALHLAYLVAGFKKGDEVITTPNTFVATTNMLLSVGAKPIFCDIRLDTYNIDEEEIKKLISCLPARKRKKLKAIVPLHFGGQPCEMNKIKKIAKKYKLLIIEDACHALGAEYRNNKIGNCKFSDMAIFSFHPVKSITTGEGGAILTNNKEYYEKLISLRSHGIYKDTAGKNIMTDLGYNYRMTDIQAALGISQMKKLSKFIKKRRQVVRWYKQELKDKKDIILPLEFSGNRSSWHIYVIRVVKEKVRDKLMKYLKVNGVGVNFHYPAVYSHPYYQQNGYKNFKLVNAEKYQNSCITLPLHTKLTKKNIKYIGDCIKSFYA
ncbi:MAG: UDP-4-amino-4,6-dideoxy-N-acetyl-beta-L-altrosamine transaminase [Patescibacteria group bacterium]|nr:UDP-4-amino-4,6-dideoxy-N-acetyl-beta-L-altrosamine transaminase [Patescibacteria group bacterium]MDD5294693.1 UDP-4-amino-4,6-dideoxy-N-acetyl-beta-L-altrosamine transaminase [Patescibacteria group bacterium]MDD5554435.1 UDP-4-amino-4,6-dideoxy-N-acetyl-beta-L-altrosamine transaminase [Patescibacteria group bacterium]